MVRPGRQGAKETKWLSIFGFLLLFLSIVFWKLDKRNKELVRNGEEALKYLDEQENLQNKGAEPHALKLFAHDDYLAKVRVNTSRLGIHFTYSIFLSTLFISMSLLGLITGLFCLFI